MMERKIKGLSSKLAKDESKHDDEKVKALKGAVRSAICSSKEEGRSSSNMSKPRESLPRRARIRVRVLLK